MSPESESRVVRVGIADDSRSVRTVLRSVLEEAGFEVPFAARDGVDVVTCFERERPDALLLDIAMPRRDGVAALKEIRKICPRTPVIMFSSLARRGAAAVMQALALGANDYVIKPRASGLEEATAELSRELVPRITALVSRQRGREGRPAVVRTLRPQARRQEAFQIVVVGASTGGPGALHSFLSQLPASLPVPVLVVQHMPPVFTETLSEQLDAKVALSVKEAREGDVISAGGVWLAPGDFHMGLASGGRRIAINQQAPIHHCRPAVDFLFRSAVEHYWSGTLGVVLTGMGVDGLRGSRDIVNAGGAVAIQDEASAPVWGMPGAVAQASLASHVGSPEELARIVLSETDPGGGAVHRTS